MTVLTVSSALNLKAKEIISLYGAGGKTTLLNLLADEAVRAGKKVVLTTTTRVWAPTGVPVVVAESLRAALPKIESELRASGLVWLGSGFLRTGKLAGIEPDWAGDLAGLADCVLVEADGAAGKPVKGFAPHEPVLPAATTTALAVLGLDALAKPVLEGAVHRPEHLSHQAGVACGQRLDIRHLARLLQHMRERAQAQAPGACFTAVLNKADLLPEASPVNRFREELKDTAGFERVLFTTAADFPVRFVLAPGRGGLELPVACVVLAAGLSRRMGRDKLREDLGGLTVLEQTLAGALSSGAREVIVVTRPESAGWVKSLPAGDRVRVVVNHSYLRGQSTSIRTGIEACAGVQAVIFALGDQPLVGAAVYDGLRSKHARTLCLAAYPTFAGWRGNPVLFDRRTFPLLLGLEGDTGGRAVLDALPGGEALAVPVDDSGVLTDIDTPEDLAGLQRAQTPGMHTNTLKRQL
jgi:molybdenum cofactor cytidylyltransferase